jgi:hypothetical protein
MLLVEMVLKKGRIDGYVGRSGGNVMIDEWSDGASL